MVASSPLDGFLVSLKQDYFLESTTIYLVGIEDQNLAFVQPSSSQLLPSLDLSVGFSLQPSRIWTVLAANRVGPGFSSWKDSFELVEREADLWA